MAVRNSEASHRVIVQLEATPGFLCDFACPNITDL